MTINRASLKLDRQHWRAWVAGSLAVLTVAVAADLLFGTPGFNELRGLGKASQATTVYDVHGAPVFTIFKERRIAIPLRDVSRNVIHAVLATEDQRFYQHHGLDLWRIGGAMVANVKKGAPAQGGSTITQQLARKSFLSDAKTLRRKMKEMFVAVRVERYFTKDQILELYLNKVYFGDGFYGIEAASLGYFGKRASQLAIEEAALLAGLIKAPSAHSPTAHGPRALARRNVVLKQMVSAGYLDAATAQALQSAPVRLKNGFPPDREGQYFKNHITRLLVEQLGWETVSRDGLRVYATIDAKAQRAAEEAVNRGLERAEKFGGPARRNAKGKRPASPAPKAEYLQGALIAMDPATGEVRAMVGGRQFGDSQFNRAVQAERQAGSAFKPFVYAAALETGYTPATLVTDLDDPISTPQGAWVPEDGHSSASAMTVRAAIRTSSNRAAVQVLRTVGIPRAVSYADRLGLEAPAVPSLVLGSGEVSLLSITAAYGAFANGGVLRTPVFIRRVEDANGRVLMRGVSEARQAVSPQTAYQMAQMLADVINSGTGYRARQAGFHAPAAGKTGTTNDYRDAWFIGFTPTLVAGVWVGFDQPKTIASRGYAGELAAPIWGVFMKGAANPKDTAWLKPPPGIVSAEICRASGALPGEGCHRVLTVDRDGFEVEKSMVGMEYFRAGTEPQDHCTMHVETLSLGDRFRRLFGGGR
jgi:1A family penicillin-binding protein